MRFIDYLDVSQHHLNLDLPIVAQEIKTSTDTETGLVRQSVTMKRYQGSYSSVISVKCDGSTVSVSGNPSRWGRPDNLYGLTTFEQCIQVYNTILISIGLPPFTKCTRFDWLQGSDGKKATLTTDGALFSRVDWTRNFSVGKGNEKDFIRGISSYSIGKGIKPFLYSNGHTVTWGGKGSLWYQKVYNKSEDLRKNLKSQLKANPHLPSEDKSYLQKLIEYCDQKGIVRDEKEFKSRLLRKEDLCFYGLTKESDFNKYLTDIDKIIERIEMSTVDYVTISDQLLDKRIVKSRQAANATQACAMAWLHNQNISLQKSSYYVHKSRLLQLGIDISNPHDVTKGIPQLKRQREIVITDVTPPPWYQMPSTNHLRLVA